MFLNCGGGRDKVVVPNKPELEEQNKKNYVNQTKNLFVKASPLPTEVTWFVTSKCVALFP